MSVMTKYFRDIQNKLSALTGVKMENILLQFVKMVGFVYSSLVAQLENNQN